MTTRTVTNKEAVCLGRMVTSRRERAGSVVATNRATAEPRRMPLFISADEAYYWSCDWQGDVRKSMEALRAGEFKDFDSDDPNDVARWLLSVDEDDCD